MLKTKKVLDFRKKNIVGGSLWDTFKKGASFVKNIVPKDAVKSVINTGVDAIVPDKYKDLAKSAVNAGVNTAYDGKVNKDDVKMF